MEQWKEKEIVTALEYEIQFLREPEEKIDAITRQILRGDRLPYSARAIVTALTKALNSDESLGHFLPSQPHSDETLRLVFRRLIDALTEHAH